ncbi:LysR family transcriptional regulator [Bradyrhizobium sp.]|uniref:helix-turn-helix domain-containing protein n=1 Tax=Bradyrhizobium sp. TaxID=376 RepID=UPI00391A3B57
MQTTQAAISLKLRRLENRLGCRLIERTPQDSAMVATGSGSPARGCQFGLANQPNFSSVTRSPSLRPACRRTITASISRRS